MAEVEFKNVNKTYGKNVEAVKNLSFKFKDKEFFAILGPSGCGKSSSLRMLAGLEDITSGDIMIGNQKVNDYSPRERNVAMSFENYGLYPDFTVYGNIAYPLSILKLPKTEINKKVYRISQLLHLTPLLNNMPSSLSSGQKQRVSIARALVRNPDVTIMDEPLSHVDAKMRNDMRSVIKRIHNKLELTTVYVTHDQIEAMSMADEILIMNEGVAQQIGTPDEVYSEPANLFVAGFIGSPQMNLVECNVACDLETISCENSFDLKLNQYAGKLRVNQAVVLGIRPHDVTISRVHFDGSIEGTVYVSELLGETTIISIQAGKEIIKAEVDGLQLDWDYDEVIYFKFNCEKIHLFDLKTQSRIHPR